MVRVFSALNFMCNLIIYNFDIRTVSRNHNCDTRDIRVWNSDNVKFQHWNEPLALHQMLEKLGLG